MPIVLNHWCMAKNIFKCSFEFGLNGSSNYVEKTTNKIKIIHTELHLNAVAVVNTVCCMWNESFRRDDDFFSFLPSLCFALSIFRSHLPTKQLASNKSTNFNEIFNTHNEVTEILLHSRNELQSKWIVCCAGLSTQHRISDILNICLCNNKPKTQILWSFRIGS